VSRAPLPEVRGSRIAGLIERERALLLLRKQRARHVQLSFGEALIVTREGEGEQTEKKGDEEMAKKSDDQVLNKLARRGVSIGPIVTLRVGDAEGKGSDLLPCAIQPANRTLEVRSLKSDIEAAGSILVPILVAGPFRGKYETADGHRRITVARMLGWETIEARVVSGLTTEEIWRLVNGGKPQTGSNWFASWARWDSELDRSNWLAKLRPAYRRNIKKMIGIFGLARTIELGRGEYQLDPNIARTIEKLHAVCCSRLRDGAPTMRAIGEWLVSDLRRRRDMSDLAKMTTAKIWNRFAAAVKRRRPFPREEWS
jgi:hypothetical protein